MEKATEPGKICRCHKMYVNHDIFFTYRGLRLKMLESTV